MRRVVMNLGWGFALLAMLIATVGVHVFHLGMHHHVEDCSCDGCCGHVRQASETVSPHVCELHAPAGPCAVCSFLAAFHGQPSPAGPPIMWSATIAGSIAFVVSSPSSIRLDRAHHSRAPPSCVALRLS